jgi:hypothetical protein
MIAPSSAWQLEVIFIGLLGVSGLVPAPEEELLLLLKNYTCFAEI